mgnify:CR=1 FL=1
MLDFDVVVIGCGVAGMTSALYLKRANINACIIEKNAPGGQLNMILDINNYPGFKSIDGPSLAFNMFEQIRELNVPYKYANVLEIINEKDKKIVKTNKGDITCKGIIIANGRRPRELGVEDEKKLIGRGISYCSICDGTLYKDKDVCVVGGGNAALESALYLSDICNKVYLIHRRDEFRGENMSLEKIKNKDNIEIKTCVKIKKINEKDNKLSGVLLDNGEEISCEAVFVNVGNVPMPIKCEGLNTDEGYIIVDEKMKTNIDKIYACGDIIKKDVYQISTATGEGTIAAMSLIKEL